MRSKVYAVVTLMCFLAGCAARQGAWDIPDREAVYDRPLEEVWPEVRQFFTENDLPFREDKGSMVLQTEWREEFGGSKVSGYWHRYLVLGKRESPTQSKLWVIRITKSANKALSQAGKEIDWGVTRTIGTNGSGGSTYHGNTFNTDGEPFLDVEDFEARFDAPRGENSYFAESGQGTRDLTMEWRVFRAVEPRLAKNAPQPVQVVARAPEAKAAPSAVSMECGLPIVGLGKQVKKGGVLLLGELHGTQEVPRFVAQAACQSVVAGIPVTVGLELPVESQERMAAFLTSEGKEEDWLKLMDAPFWRSPYPDGRSSEAMANMLEQLRQLRARGLDVEAFVFDHPKLQGQVREEAMAATVMSRVKHAPDRFFLVISGNVHPRTKAGLPWDGKYQPMGLLLSKHVKDVVALDMAYDSGSAWICAVDSKGRVNTLDCGVREAKGKDNGDRFFVHTWGGVNDEGFHGVFYVGPVNASAPAVHKGLGRPGENDNSVHPPSESGRTVASVH
ncbi:hypothetical protein [Myxococcus sp. RHSTA-1-4]|uniref:hypothetical protein n=1 Tax=Myxococcus sp. RHSTA-1-4 TaxID=2874601 RepID=UPI001CBD8282|nr:hypothetical protein [Myxococcus sp. RHSTA-1-4]MBZ4415278.1 hypothetical protein [Myxococcus sp. RHSTA-1-4]